MSRTTPVHVHVLFLVAIQVSEHLLADDALSFLSTSSHFSELRRRFFSKVLFRIPIDATTDHVRDRLAHVAVAANVSIGARDFLGRVFSLDSENNVELNEDENSNSDEKPVQALFPLEDVVRNLSGVKSFKSAIVVNVAHLLPMADSLNELILEYGGFPPSVPLANIMMLSSFTHLTHLNVNYPNVPEFDKIEWNLLVNLQDLTCFVNAPCFSATNLPPRLQNLTVQKSPHDLSSIRFCKSLVKLTVVLSRAFPVSILPHLSCLTSLHLSYGAIEDLSSIKCLENLADLFLNVSSGDLSPLSIHKKLQTLAVRSRRATDLTPLSCLTSLQYLCLNGCAFAIDLDPLKYLVNLQGLALDQKMVDLSPLSNLTQLIALDLARSSATDFSFFLNLTQLQDVNLNAAKHFDSTQLQFLVNLSNMHTLKLWRTGVDDLTPLRNMTKLEYLDISDTAVPTLDALSNAIRLKALKATNTFLSNEGVVAISNLKSLIDLDLTGNTLITDISFLQGHVRLRSLNIRQTNVQDLTPLAGVYSLRELTIWGTKVETLEPLFGMHITHLYCNSENEVLWGQKWDHFPIKRYF
ncbi:L domain-like protein [Rhizoclosmatium globosum]|uniref:L domain-like protein n=1 Tax=Rhizoclosmatium globosum TaxID=329046 RepID=A0A1Y2CMV2_9FUNG|nr:L domain-like protein [Rhizoclosmatium globosum]|eukprot:ORY48266.1 L domain-like protein [Rhizoclosmatium globosum]